MFGHFHPCRVVCTCPSTMFSSALDHSLLVLQIGTYDTMSFAPISHICTPTHSSPRRRCSLCLGWSHSALDCSRLIALVCLLSSVCSRLLALICLLSTRAGITVQHCPPATNGLVSQPPNTVGTAAQRRSPVFFSLSRRAESVNPAHLF